MTAIQEFLTANYSDSIDTIANYGVGSGIISELIYHSDIDTFYAQHKEEIDNIVEEVFYDVYVGQPQAWFDNAAKNGFNLVNIDDARRFYTYLAVEVTAQNMINE